MLIGDAYIHGIMYGEATAWKGMNSNFIEHGCEHLSLHNNQTAFEEQDRSSVSFFVPSQ